jgi:hypothetical protein
MFRGMLRRIADAALHPERQAGPGPLRQAAETAGKNEAIK